MNDTLEVSRHELKYLINYAQYITLTNSLKNVLIEDEYNGTSGYLIRSLYFDTYAETDFYHKLAGVDDRKKIRLRVYSPGDEHVKLEIKRKFCDDQVKKTAIISRAAASRLIDCDYDVLLQYDNKIIRMIYEVMRVNHVRPVVLTEYRRTAFIHPTNNIRITLDTEIRSSETCFDIFDKNPVFTPVEDFAFALVEVKYDAFIMRWLSELLSRHDLVRSSYSKYFMSRGLYERYLA